MGTIVATGWVAQGTSRNLITPINYFSAGLWGFRAMEGFCLYFTSGWLRKPIPGKVVGTAEVGRPEAARDPDK